MKLPDRHEGSNIGFYLDAVDLAVGQIYLLYNPLLREPLRLSHIKPTLLGHWGTLPDQNFIYVHLNRVIKQYDSDMIYISGLRKRRPVSRSCARSLAKVDHPADHPLARTSNRPCARQ